MSNASPRPFDPYHKWLGIPPAEQPPTWYRLLGIPLFESDPDVIDAAADQRMTHLRKYQAGVNSALSQQLLNEVASARIVLLSPEKKAVYDAELRAKIEAAAKRLPKLPVPVAMAPSTGAQSPMPAGNIPVGNSSVAGPGGRPAATAASGPLAKASAPKPRWMTGLIVGLSVAAGTVLLGLVYWLLQGPIARPPVAPIAGASKEPKAEPHPAVAPTSPTPSPHHDETKVAVRENPPAPPAMLEPVEGALLGDMGRPENAGKGWDFRWSPVAKAVKYHLRVLGPSDDNNPLIDNSELTHPSYHYNGIVPPTVADRRGWRWKVRAMLASQTWSDWSFERKFDIEPPLQVAGPAGGGPSAVPENPSPDNPPPKETAAAAPTQAETPARAPVPDNAALAKAKKEVFDIYSAEYQAARSTAQKVDLAKKFLDQAAASANEPAARYVLLKSAQDLASQVGDAAVAFQAIDELNTVFDVDGTGMKVEALNKVAKATLTPAQLKPLVDQILALMDELVEQDRFEEALALAPAALDRARRSHDGDLTKQVNQHKKEVEAMRKAFVPVQSLAERLSKQPDDAEANYGLGRYTAATKGDWKKGLPMLAKGSDASWQKLARRELASPSANTEQLALADGWYEIAQLAPEAEKNALFLHAGAWYRKAQPGVAAGLNKARLEKRLAEIDQLDQPSRASETRRPAALGRKSDFKLGKAVDILRRVDVARDQVSGQWKRTNDGIVGTGATSYTRLMLPVAIDGSYDLQIAFVPQNRRDEMIVVVPFGTHGCAVLETTSYVEILAAPLKGFVGYRQLMMRSFGIINGLPRHVLLISVRMDGDAAKLGVAVDGVPEITYACEKDSLDVPSEWALPSPGHPGLATMGSDTPVFGAAMLRMVSGKASWAEPAAAKPQEKPDRTLNDPAAERYGKPSAAKPQKKAPGQRLPEN